MIWHWYLVLFIAVEARIVFESDYKPQNLSGENVLHINTMDSPTRARADRLVSQAIGKLALELENVVVKSTREDNIVFSPLSIACVLGLVLLGAQGVTYTEVANLLGVSTGVDLTGRTDLVHEELGALINHLRARPGMKKGLEISIASAVFVEKAFEVKDRFINISKEAYLSEVIKVEFQNNPEYVRQQMNKWVEDKTNGRIHDFFRMAPSQLTKVILANAIYFNGEWLHQFYPERITKMKPFYLEAPNGQYETIQLPTMVNNAEIPYFVDQKRNCTIIGLPYKENEVAMFVIVPQGNIRGFVNKLTVSDIEELVNSTVVTSVIYFLPRMKLESTVNLREPLEDLGVKSLFRPGLSNLSNIANDVFASEAIHKVEIEVTETGTVAAAATGISINRDGTTPVVKVDRPFVFFIRHNETGIILFWGTVTKPKPYIPHTPHSHSRPSQS